MIRLLFCCSGGRCYSSGDYFDVCGVMTVTTTKSVISEQKCEPFCSKTKKNIRSSFVS